MTDTTYPGSSASRSTPGGANADVSGKIKDAASHVMHTAQHEAGNAASSVQDKAKDSIEQGKQAASHTLVDFAGAIRKAGDELAQHDQSMAGRLVKQAADGLENLSHAVADKRPDELIDALRDLGRRSPGAVLAGSVLIGLALGRFAKSSAKPDADSPAANGQSTAASTNPPMAMGAGVPVSQNTWAGTADKTAYGRQPDTAAGGASAITGGNGSGY